MARIIADQHAGLRRLCAPLPLHQQPGIRHDFGAFPLPGFR